MLRPSEARTSTLAFLCIRVGGDRRLERTRALVDQLTQVLERHRVTGKDCYILRVAVADTAELDSLVDQLVTIGDLISSIVPVQARRLTADSRANPPAALRSA